MADPKISIITVNFNGKKYLPELLDSLKSQTYPVFEVLMVDNGSTDGSADFVKEKYPWVKIIRSRRNVGFAEGNNLGLKHSTGEFIALINNDMVADCDWLRRLLSASFDKNADVVGPKILFYKPFLSFRFETETFTPDNGDSRRLGVRIASDARIESSGYDKILFGQNTFGEEMVSGTRYHWISDGGIVKIPYDPRSGIFELSFQVAAPVGSDVHALRIRLGDGSIVFERNIADDFRNYRVQISEDDVKRNGRFVVNNASSRYSESTGYGLDIGMGEDDIGQFDTSGFVQALCGGCMLIRRDILGKAGIFDDYFFAYYEDTDFCWRMNTVGRTLYFEPKSVVYHIHTGTSKEWSPFFRYHTDRNRLAMLIKNASIQSATRELVLFLIHSCGVKTLASKMTIMRIVAWLDVVFHMPYLLVRRFKKT